METKKEEEKKVIELVSLHTTTTEDEQEFITPEKWRRGWLIEYLKEDRDTIGDMLSKREGDADDKEEWPLSRKKRYAQMESEYSTLSACIKDLER